MKQPRPIQNYFSKTELILWGASTLLIVSAFLLFDRTNPETLIASLIGTTSLIFSAKGNPLGPLLMILFSGLYGRISYTFSYYGEMITYLGMTAPMSLFAFLSWCRHPYRGNKKQVAVNRLQKGEFLFLSVLTVAVTVIFYFLLRHFGTANLIPGTVSVTTSFLAVYLTFRRSPLFALAYAANDFILILLWILASKTDPSYLSVTVCFAVFFVNDLYGFINWKKMQKTQSSPPNKGSV